MRALLFTTGSPFARAVRIVLDELALDWERREEITTPSAAERAQATPTLQVPTLWDGDKVIWESGLIVEYLLSTYPDRPDADPPMAPVMYRQDRVWHDKLVFSTIQTLGAAVTTISQMTWGGLPFADNAHLTRCAERVDHLLRWLDAKLAADGDGFLPGVISAQDIFLACHVRFMQNRPLGLTHDMGATPRIAALLDRLDARSSLIANPIYWWEPGVTGYSDDGTPNYAVDLG